MMRLWEISFAYGMCEMMQEGEEVVGNFPCIREMWNGCLKVMRLFETSLAYRRCGMDA